MQKKRNIHTEDTTSHAWRKKKGKKKKEKKKRKKKKKENYVPGIMKLAHSTKLSTSSLTRAVVSIAKLSHSPDIGEWRGRSAHVVPSAL